MPRSVPFHLTFAIPRDCHPTSHHQVPKTAIHLALDTYAWIASHLDFATPPWSIILKQGM